MWGTQDPCQVRKVYWLGLYMLASPAEGDRAVHRVLHSPAALLGLETRPLQREIPLRRTIGIIDQHQAWD